MPMFQININCVVEENERIIDNKIKNIENPDLTYFQKRLIILIEEKTKSYEIEHNNNSKEENKNNTILLFNEPDNSISLNDQVNSTSYIDELNSTSDNSKSYMSNDLSINSKSNSVIPKFENKKFNPIRANYYLKYNLYDKIINTTFDYPPIYIINEKYHALVYPNELISYGFIQSGFLKNNNIKNNSNNIDNNNNSKYNDKLGLYFCGKDVQIKLGDEIHIKKCKPNEFICKECMEINKKKYNINDKYLININGRVAKINKGSYHCFGHFLCVKDNQIEDCISKFSCKACKLLDKYSKFFQ